MFLLKSIFEILLILNPFHMIREHVIVLYSEQQLLASSFNVLSSLHPNSLVGGGGGGGRGEFSRTGFGLRKRV